MSISSLRKASAAAMALTILTAATTTAARPLHRVLNGNWIIGDGEGVLTIRGSRWLHPKYGAGTIRRGEGSANYEVFYDKHQGVRCAYRVMTIAGGEILVLEVADETQSPDYCPRGKLSRADR
jgi:hypothetical protein